MMELMFQWLSIGQFMSPWSLNRHVNRQRYAKDAMGEREWGRNWTRVGGSGAAIVLNLNHHSFGQDGATILFFAGPEVNIGTELRNKVNSTISNEHFLFSFLKLSLFWFKPSPPQ